MYELALFAGAGGGLLASKLLGWRTVCYVEWEKYAVEVLKARIRDGYLDDAPIWDDCSSFDGTPWAGLVDVVTAGFPCQPFSSSGKGLAENDPRNGWPAVQRILGEVQPSFAFLENVQGLVSKPYIRRIFGDLAEIGYDAEWGIVSAASVGAPHMRKRLWIVAYAHHQRPTPAIQYIRSFQCQAATESGGNGKIKSLAHAVEWQSNMAEQSRQEGIYPARNGIEATMADAKCISMEKQRDKQPGPRVKQGDWWSIEPRLGRVANGVAHRVDRLATIGNGQVPEVARTAWNLLLSRIIQEPVS